MNKLYKLAVAFVACLSVVSCGGSKSDDGENGAKDKIKVKPEVAVRGPLGEYFTMVDREYTITNNGYSYEVTVEVERNDEMAPFDESICYFSDSDKSNSFFVGGFGYEILDADGNIIAKGTPDGAAYSHSEMSAALRTMMGQTNSITFHIYDNFNETPATIRLISDVKENSSYGLSESSDSAADLVESEDASKISDGIDEALDDVSKQASDAMKNVQDAYEAGKAAVEMVNQLNKLL